MQQLRQRLGAATAARLPALATGLLFGMLGTSLVVGSSLLGGCGDGTGNPGQPDLGVPTDQIQPSPDEGTPADDLGAFADADAGTDSAAPAIQAPELGNPDDPSSVTLTEIATSADKLNKPRDLAFNSPMRPDELWVVNQGDESATIIHQATSDGRMSEWRKDGYAMHFMAKVSSIAFGGNETSALVDPSMVGMMGPAPPGEGRPGTFATCQESRNDYDGTQRPNDFMGPVLWSSDLDIFAKFNPMGLGSHLDMLHNSPLCTGIAWQEKNVYWVFNGKDNAIDKYDFAKDDGIGRDNHGDGLSWRYVPGQVLYQAGVTSGLVYQAETQTLYIADSGNGRIAKLDTTMGTQGQQLLDYEGRQTFWQMDGTMLTDVVPASTRLLGWPAGMKLRNNLLYVADNYNGRISAFTLDGQLVNYLETGLPQGTLNGIEFGPDGKLYFVDTLANRVVRIDSSLVPPAQ